MPKIFVKKIIWVSICGEGIQISNSQFISCGWLLLPLNVNVHFTRKIGNLFISETGLV
jgi:hypothetical protein